MILQSNVPYGMDICFSNCENRTRLDPMSEYREKVGVLPVFHARIPRSVTYYKLKIKFREKTEGDTN